MKTMVLQPTRRRQSGILLTECLVYMAVFVILFGIATSAFFLCLEHTRGIVAATNNIENAQRAGERWRADIRRATGKIEVKTDADGETVRIPETGKDILYHFAAGQLRREVTSPQYSEVLLPGVKNSGMTTDPRGIVTAWRWELELMPVHKESLPLRFTFEAVPASP
jgi:hypothetical protein